MKRMQRCRTRFKGKLANITKKAEQVAQALAMLKTGTKDLSFGRDSFKLLQVFQRMA